MEKVKTRPWDSAAHLKTEEDVAEYFDACLVEGGDDPAFIAHVLGVIARARGMSQVARDAEISREGLYKALSAEGNPSFGTILRVIKALGLQLHATRASA
ncbi:addiction module antidote protein [Trinickia acidisoli]|uniref:addiction module antidote protein n=1 Tax=Trinickia acidisoli TaxID=2767482 RepID=UPI001A9064C8|nr:addiction module antidote protein [Trinickia acidisoli]